MATAVSPKAAMAPMQMVMVQARQTLRVMLLETAVVAMPVLTAPAMVQETPDRTGQAMDRATQVHAKTQLTKKKPPSNLAKMRAPRMRHRALAGLIVLQKVLKNAAIALRPKAAPVPSALIVLAVSSNAVLTTAFQTVCFPPTAQNARPAWRATVVPISKPARGKPAIRSFYARLI